jgi:ribosomal-protein-alanine N-acetyltransferase
MMKLVETDRLIIRNLTDDDLDSLLIYRSNPDVVRYQTFDVMDRAALQLLINSYKNASWENGQDWVQYGIVQKSTGELIGDCALRIDDDTAQIGMTLSHLKRGNGFATEAMSGLLKYVFEKCGVRRVVETTDVRNRNSIALLQRLGFREEGHFVENAFIKGEWTSEYQYAMLRREWDARG